MNYIFEGEKETPIQPPEEQIIEEIEDSSKEPPQDTVEV